MNIQTPKTFVYLLHAEGTRRSKIGFSEKPAGRTYDLNIASPYPIHMIGLWQGDRKAERYLHKVFNAYRVHGEWFELPDVEQNELLARISEELINAGYDGILLPTPERSAGLITTKITKEGLADLRALAGLLGKSQIKVLEEVIENKRLELESLDSASLDRYRNQFQVRNHTQK